MSIFETVTEQMKDAMRAREEVRLGALRGIRAAFLTEMKKDGAESLPDDVCSEILRRLEKQRKESIAAFEGAGRAELVARETEELGVISSFLPQLADEETTRSWVDAAIAASGATGPRDMGKVMGALMKAHKGEVDGGLARELAQAALAAGEDA